MKLAVSWEWRGMQSPGAYCSSSTFTAGVSSSPRTRSHSPGYRGGCCAPDAIEDGFTDLLPRRRITRRSLFNLDWAGVNQVTVWTKSLRPLYLGDANSLQDFRLPMVLHGISWLDSGGSHVSA